MKKSKLLPFWMMPASWGLSGLSKRQAEIAYYFDGFERDSRLLELEYDTDSRDYRINLIKLKEKYGLLEQRSSRYALANEEIDEAEKEIKLATLDFEYGVINNTEYEKRIATAKKEPWTGVIDLSVDENNPSYGSFKLDWNTYFIDSLKAAGYNIPLEDQHDKDFIEERIVGLWFIDVCKNIALEHYDGVGDINDRLGESFVKKTKIDDGIWVSE